MSDTPPVLGIGSITTQPVGSIHPSPDNPRKIPQSAIEAVAKSITTFGWQQPIVVDRDNIVIVGHTRLLAAKLLKLKTVPVVVADHLTREEARAYRIADNRTGDFTSWDFTVLTQQLDELAEEFSDVLALADWQAIVSTLDDAELALPEQADVPDGMSAYLSGQFCLTVACETEEAARTVAAAVIDMPGVIDVRNKR